VAAGLYDDRFTDLNLVRRHFNHLTATPNCDGSGEKIEKALDSPPASSNREPLQYLGGKHEAGDNQGGEELSNCQSRQERDGHREFHRHFAFNDVFESFPENGVSADQGGHDADDADVRKRLPKPKPDCSGSHGHESDADEFGRLDSMFVFFVLGVQFRFLSFWGTPPLAGFGRDGRCFVDIR